MRSFKIFWLILLSLVFVSKVHSSPVSGVRGVVPLKYQRAGATDLVYQGSILSPQQAHELHVKHGVDLSELEPDQSSDHWKNQIGLGLDPSLDALGVFEGDEVEFIDTVPTPIGQVKAFRFTVSKVDEFGIPRVYTVMVAKRAHTFLLRKALLRKLGYNIPAIKHLKNLNVKFSSSLKRNRDFLGCVHDDEECRKQQEEDEEDGRLLKNNMYTNAGHPERWVTNWEDIQSLEANMQDVLVFAGDVHIYNLAVAPLASQTIRGRRVFNALLVPFNLVDVRETANGFFWYSGRHWNETVYLPLEDPQDFRTSFEDAKWILKKIALLSEQDIAEIVSEAKYPQPVAKLLVEKIKSRRNELMRLFSLNIQALPVNPNISHGNCLKNGKLTAETCWSGYGSNFLYSEEESPVSRSEIVAYLKSKGIGVILDNLVDKINRDLIPSSDLGKIVMEEQKKKAQENFIKFLKSGLPQDTDFGIWTHPIYSGRIQAEREVIAGSFLGADNVIQLADTLGFAVDAGLFIGTHGLKPGYLVDGSGKVFLQRSYTHLKPIQSIKKSLKEPFRNILVPLVKRRFGVILDELLDGSLKDLEPEERAKKIKQVLNLFKENLGDKESLIITNSFGGSLGVRAGYKFAERVRAQAAVSGSRVILSRTHILRAGDTIHIYKDYGKSWAIQLNVSLKAGVQVAEFQARGMKGVAQVKFHTLNIDHEQEDWREILKNVKALRSVLIKNSVEGFEGWKEPHIFRHKVSEKQSDWRFLFWTGFKQNSFDQMDVEFPQKQKARFVRRTSGRRTGNDFQALTVDVINTLIEELDEDSEVDISNKGSGNPGDTLYGKSYSRNAIFEAEVNTESQQFDEAFVAVNYRWKGWKSKKRKFKKILKKLEKKYDYDFYQEQAFHLTRNIQLYTLYLKVFIYHEGIQHMAYLSKSQVERLFGKWSQVKNMDRFERQLRSYFRHQKRYKRYLREGKLRKATNSALKMVSLVESSFPVKGLIEAAGGSKNIYITGTVEGFKEGEDGGQALEPVISNDIGLYGRENVVGPLEKLRQFVGMTLSEFYIYWFLRKI